MFSAQKFLFVFCASNTRLFRSYRKHTHVYHRKNGKVTREAMIIDKALRFMDEHHGTVQSPAAAFRNKHHLVLAFPFRRLQAFARFHYSLLTVEPQAVHRKETFFALYGIVKPRESSGRDGGLPLELGLIERALQRQAF